MSKVVDQKSRRLYQIKYTYNMYLPDEPLIKLADRQLRCSRSSRKSPEPKEFSLRITTVKIWIEQ